MIGKIGAPRGRRVEGLIYYLFGPGRRAEHTDPHIVAFSRVPNLLHDVAPGAQRRTLQHTCIGVVLVVAAGQTLGLCRRATCTTAQPPTRDSLIMIQPGQTQETSGSFRSRPLEKSPDGGTPPNWSLRYAPAGAATSGG